MLETLAGLMRILEQWPGCKFLKLWPNFVETLNIRRAVNA
jgi:hypothetical protein